MHLEQKLPMAWHAFNETPNFQVRIDQIETYTRYVVIAFTIQEIPEFKTIYRAQNYFAVSKASFWNFYRDYKPFTDPSDWFPPFQGKNQSNRRASLFY